MTINSQGEWANAIEDAEQVMLRWGHGQVRRVPDEIAEAIVAALRVPVSERGTSERDVETLRLIERHRIRLQWWPTPDSEMWSADASGNKYVATHRSLHEAVRACVASIPAERKDLP